MHPKSLEDCLVAMNIDVPGKRNSILFQKERTSFVVPHPQDFAKSTFMFSACVKLRVLTNARKGAF